MHGEVLSLEIPPGSSRTPDKSVFQAIDKILGDHHDPLEFLGWVRLPEDKSASTDVSHWLKNRQQNQKTLCVLGIGGSCLGAKAAYDFLNPAREVLFFDNVDGYSFESRLSRLDLKRCHFLAISKSGETSETLFQLAHILQLLQRKKLKAERHVTVITEAKASSMGELADDLKLPRLTVPLDVGGRFSVFTAVGLAPLMGAGVSAKRLLEGASWVKDQRNLVAQMSAYYLDAFQRSEWISVFWFYVENLKTFGLWVEQLWAESLGKARTRAGEPAPRTSTPLTCIGATDQHSLLQQFTEGARDKHFLFVRSRQSESSMVLKKVPHPKLRLTQGRSVGELLGIEAAATQKILSHLGIATAKLTFDKQDERSLGALFFFMELVVATVGECLDINAFDQPGVEAV